MNRIPSPSLRNTVGNIVRVLELRFWLFSTFRRFRYYE